MVLFEETSYLDCVQKTHNNSKYKKAILNGSEINFKIVSEIIYKKDLIEINLKLNGY